MSTAMTAAGESLVARLQAEGKPLVIDRMIFALVPEQDHAAPVPPGAGVPEGQVVHEYAIPPEYRAYVNPNQVVYSAMLGSDVGDFRFNWQGLYCSAHDVLVAVATFPALEKRRFDVAAGKAGNNLTRNFLLEFSGAREITGLTVSADVWQLDFTVRLLGMDERERLSNFDLYGQGYFEGNGWLLANTAGSFAFTPGVGYVGGIRAALAAPLPLAVMDFSREVWLSVCLRPVGSDRVAEASPLLVPVGERLADARDETGLVHYRALVARINADGSVTDLRPTTMQGLPSGKIGAAPANRTISVTAPLTGGGDLTADRTLGINAASAATPEAVVLRDASGRAKVAAPAAADDIARKAEVDARAPATRKIVVTAPLTGGGDLTADRGIGINASSASTANSVILRDAAGRAQVAAPVASADIARKAEVDNLADALAFPWGAAKLYQTPVLVHHAGKVWLWLRASGPGVAGVGAKTPGAGGSEAYWQSLLNEYYLFYQLVTTSTSWTCPADGVWRFTVGGAGGAGGYVNTVSPSTGAAGGGGGSGAVCIIERALGKGTVLPIVIGAGGNGAIWAPVASKVGGATTLSGTLVVAPGGQAGEPVTGNNNYAGSGASLQPTSPSSTDPTAIFLQSIAGGHACLSGPFSTTPVRPGFGGPTPVLGGGAMIPTITTDGRAGTLGAGGSGGCINGAFGNVSGGNGGNGFVMIQYVRR